ncbi:hypothetical protein HELRODRAFT_179892 [Helobdella robusta]|uniref:F-box domain-containing protein n=1 Tax=Helobdella robusta TaxID=6412 RepID=T1FF83_HELRO|nr:hypothetical protein HELRODRAFT_179892 [Helobdella robusta]ESN95033.1 hypothetical protein HELRODRAFT_179892 [Helobdella robusta]
MNSNRTEIHPHCLNCHLIGCSYQECPVISCPQRCGHKFHKCKYDDHQFLCSQMNVPCLNAHCGCPFFVIRRQMSAHLKKCPAFVLFCNQQWGGCIKFLHDTPSEEPSSHHCIKAQDSQLDVALALKDKKELYRFMKSLSKKTIQDLRYQLTSPQGSQVQTIFVPGLKERCIPSPLVILNLDRMSFQCDNIKLCTEESISETFEQLEKHRLDLEERCICKKLFNMCFRSSVRNYNTDDAGTNNDSEKGNSGKVKSSDVDDVNEDCEEVWGSNGYNDDPTKSSPHTLNISPFLNHTLCLNMWLNDYSKKIKQSEFMYTFLCGELLRRNEFSQHYKNFHQDIQCGSDSWLDVRCPLACYGCTYSVRKFRPRFNAHLLFDRESSNFCVRPDSVFGDVSIRNSASLESSSADVLLENILENSEVSNFDNSDKHIPVKAKLRDQLNARIPILITDLPVIVLDRIFSYLDSISLKKLSLTSKQFRMICEEYLKERGMVVEVWEKIKCGDLCKWRATGYVCLSIINFFLI